MEWKLPGKQDVYLEIVERYKRYIELGIIKNGEKLPSVRSAAGEIGVNPNTVAKAYSVLEADGYVCSLPKKGAFVTYTGNQNNEKSYANNNAYSYRKLRIFFIFNFRFTRIILKIHLI